LYDYGNNAGLLSAQKLSKNNRCSRNIEVSRFGEETGYTSAGEYVHCFAENENEAGMFGDTSQ